VKHQQQAVTEAANIATDIAIDHFALHGHAINPTLVPLLNILNSVNAAKVSNGLTPAPMKLDDFVKDVVPTTTCQPGMETMFFISSQ
jgi:hypothetical protein